MDRNSPNYWRLQKCKMLGQPEPEPEANEPEKLAKPTAIPGMEPWDRALLEKKRKAKERFLRRFPRGRITAFNGPVT